MFTQNKAYVWLTWLKLYSSIITVISSVLSVVHTGYDHNHFLNETKSNIWVRLMLALLNIVSTMDM